MNGKKVYLGLGSNLGNKYENLLLAIQTISKVSKIRIDKVSSIYESPSWGFSSYNFYNLVLSIHTTISPLELLNELKKIELKMGRTKKSVNKKYEERIIDIDILLFDSIVLNHPDLILPHPEISRRNFVTTPMLELDKDILFKNNILTETLINKDNSNFLKIIGSESQMLKEKLENIKS